MSSSHLNLATVMLLLLTASDEFTAAATNVDDVKVRLAKHDVVRNCEPCGGAALTINNNNINNNNTLSRSSSKAVNKPKFRIVGGTRSVKARPWMAFLQIMEDSRCGGSIINKLFVLTAAHCMCTYFDCKVDPGTGNRLSDYDPSKDVKIFLGYKDLSKIFEMKKLSNNNNSNEYPAAKVIVHPKYNDSLFDLALIRSSRPFQFGADVQPICLPFGLQFPDVRSDAIVAGWGTLKNVECFTDDHGPSPNAQCAFPFADGDGAVHNGCHMGPNPSAGDPLCKQFRERNPGALATMEDEVMLFDTAEDRDRKAVRSCYAEGPGAKGWCATCKLVSANTSDPRLCGSGFTARVAAPDDNWGWCSKLCDDGHELLPLHLKEVTLVVFPPTKCRKMLNESNAAFGDDTELCAGFVSKRRRKSFLIDESLGVRKISFKDMTNKESEFDLVGGKDACTGDSGGPLWVELGSKSKRAFLVGVVSRGFNCASHNLPGIYVRVKMFLPWIMETSKDGKC